MHYLRQLLGESYKLIGSSNVLGNPYGFIGRLNDGFRDLVSKPLEGWQNNEFGKGLAKGTFSLAKHTIGGISMVSSSITGGVGMWRGDACM